MRSHPAGRPASSPRQSRVPPDLLALANQLRAERKWAQAEAVYQSLMKGFPEADETYVAQVAVAALRAEHLGDPRGALALYQTALGGRPKGALADEARLGIAHSFRLLGDREGEMRALEDFLAASSGSLHRARAETRLADLVRAPR